MRPYGGFSKHVPSTGPVQPKAIPLNDPTTHAERQRALAIVAEFGQRVAQGKLDHLTKRQLLAKVFMRIRDGDE